MQEDKQVNTRDLPKQWERTTTQQPEEFIDKESVRKDEQDVPVEPGSGDTTRHKGEQES